MSKKDLTGELRKAEELLKKEQEPYSLKKMKEAVRYGRDAGKHRVPAEIIYRTNERSLRERTDELKEKYQNLSLEQEVVATLSQSNKYVKLGKKEKNKNARNVYLHDAHNAVDVAVSSYSTRDKERSPNKQINEKMFAIMEEKCLKYFNMFVKEDTEEAERWLKTAKKCEDMRNGL